MITDVELKEAYKGRSVLVTGGTGMIGRQVVARLCDLGAVVRIVSLDRLRVHPAAVHVHGDLTDFGFAKVIVRGVDWVFHLAGIKGSVGVTQQKPASFFVPLMQMNSNLLEASRLSGIQRLVYTSTIGAYGEAEVLTEDRALEGEPMDRFPGWAKRMGELQLESYRIEHGWDGWRIARPASVYGPGDRFDPETGMVIPALLAKVARGDDPVKIWGDGSAVRDFVYSGDVAEGMLRAMIHPGPERLFNLGSGQGVSVGQLVETVQRVAPFRFEFDPIRPAGAARRVMDIGRARACLGYEPKTSLEQGLKTTWEWFRANAAEQQLRKQDFAETT